VPAPEPVSKLPGWAPAAGLVALALVGGYLILHNRAGAATSPESSSGNPGQAAPDTMGSGGGGGGAQVPSGGQAGIVGNLPSDFFFDPGGGETTVGDPVFSGTPIQIAAQQVAYYGNNPLVNPNAGLRGQVVGQAKINASPTGTLGPSSTSYVPPPPPDPYSKVFNTESSAYSFGQGGKM
jgi:hypothetical protein